MFCTRKSVELVWIRNRFCYAFILQDVVIVGEALQLLVLCLQLRTQLIGKMMLLS